MSLDLRESSPRIIGAVWLLYFVTSIAEPLPPGAESAANTLSDDHHHSLGG
ncbi:MAG TPA: hypothetical protein VF785_09415 [Gemmatimonadaceae bacterium]